MNLSTRMRVSIATGLLVLCVLSLLVSLSLFNGIHSPRPVPGAGNVAYNQNNGRSANGKRVLQRLHALYSTYKGIHGHYPDSFGETWEDVRANPQQFKVKTFSDMADSLRNPDAKFADSPMLRKTVTFASPKTRPDGSAKFGPKPEGTRDLLAYTTIYFHYGEGRNASGFMQVLWDDGSIEDVPVNKLISVPVAGRKGYFDYAFPGQAGMPDNTIPFTNQFGHR